MDVTDKVKFYVLDGETIALDKCVCGYVDMNTPLLVSTKAEVPYGCKSCPSCGRKLCFEMDIKVYSLNESVLRGD